MKTGALVMSVSLLGVVTSSGCDTHTAIGSLDAGPGAGGSTGEGGGSGGSTGGSPGPTGTGGVPGACGATTSTTPGSATPGTLSFLPAINYGLSGFTGSAASVALGDLNGDGRADLVATRNMGVTILGNTGGTGDGTFADPVTYPFSGYAPNSVALGEFVGDSRADLAVASYQGVNVLINDGNGGFRSPVLYAVGNSTSLALGDLNGDGKTDIAVTNSNPIPDMNDGGVAVLLNTGGGTFAAKNYSVSSRPVAIAVGDVNGDCKPDLAVGGVESGVGIFLNNGNGTFKEPTVYGAGTYPVSVSIGDLNGDGKADLAVASSLVSVGVLLNYGDGTFTAAIGYAGADPGDTAGVTTGIAVAVVIGDMNGDGKPDLAFAGNCCSASVLLNEGSGRFGVAHSYGVPPLPGSIALGNVNGDGKPDLVVGYTDGASVLINDTH